MLTTGHLFGGGGGDTKGATIAGYTPLWTVENDKYAAAAYRYRFPETRVIQADITTLTDEFIQSLPVPHIIIGGSPCPDFSLGGSRSGLKGTRGQLFFEYVRFLRLQQPPLFIFENVRGLLSSNHGQDFQKVIRAFAQVGYVGTWQLKNANRHVPQNRERIFCVGIHGRYSHISAEILQAIAC